MTLKVNSGYNSKIQLHYLMEGLPTMHYTERIRDLREDHDLTQTDIANLLHIGQRTYADYELGKTRIPLDSIIILAKYYNISLDYICGCSNVPNKFPTE